MLSERNSFDSIAFFLSVGLHLTTPYVKGDPIRASGTFLKIKHIKNQFNNQKLYWIYNLIRVAFFQNLNVYLRKTCTIVLFKVLPI